MAKNRKPVATSDLYTAILALSTFAVLATAAFVIMKCYGHYGTAWAIVGS
jgi:hypothetical protein